MAQLAGWHDYFIVVGSGAAALTALVFVAMTPHLDDIVTDPVLAIEPGPFSPA